MKLIQSFWQLTYSHFWGGRKAHGELCCGYLNMNTIIQTGIQVKTPCWGISWVQLTGKGAIWWITQKFLWFWCLQWLEITFEASACQKERLRSEAANRQLCRFGLCDFGTSASVRLDNQRVRCTFPHFWIMKAKQTAKLILVITHPESHNHNSRWLAGGCCFNHGDSNLPLVQAQDAETSGAYLDVQRVLSYHGLHWLH